MVQSPEDDEVDVDEDDDVDELLASDFFADVLSDDEPEVDGLDVSDVDEDAESPDAPVSLPPVDFFFLVAERLSVL
jgi:hypothetical protein